VADLDHARQFALTHIGNAFTDHRRHDSQAAGFDDLCIATNRRRQHFTTTFLQGFPDPL